MTQFIVGQTLTFGLRTYDTDGALADVGTGPTATLTKPDGSTASASVTKTATGTYTAAYTADASGRWACLWDGSGANSGGLPYPDVADVWPVDWRPIIPLATARATLNVGDAQTADDAEMLGYLVSARIVVEHICGPILSAEVSRTVSGGGRAALPLPTVPNSVTSVTEDGTTLTDGVDFCWDENGLLWRGSVPHAGTWSAAGVRNVTVVYEVGDTTVPQNVIQAAGYLVRHWWSQTQQASRPFMGSGYGPEEGMSGQYNLVAGYAIPNLVRELLEPSVPATRRAGFA